ncbi:MULTISPECIES: SCO family protein [unclassified Nocardioides]|uniref:SCO family protein n=1 Tax=unclassified Nocardioides TaxID=2615069 RepID=UPI0006F939E5|nr:MULTISPECIES: SCO family protein [unclassified Nocardioides]KRA37334.1 electron transport protein SCO1/SenC [Nocardioides sp. Root614]KRA91295.1 electron transport protein SCO1/SenC [Nocardioides sp. Root682]
MRRTLRLVALVTLLGLLGTACSADPEEFTGTRLKNPYAAPDIALTDTSGQPYSLVDDTDKPLTLVFFGYTKCPDFCPMVLNNIAAALNRVDDADRAKVDVVLVTTDPARDSPAVMREYLDNFNKDFIGLTGDLDTIIAVGDPMAVYVNDGKKLPTGGYDLGGHSTFTLAVDGDDEAIALWNQETSSTEFAADIHTLLNQDED